MKKKSIFKRLSSLLIVMLMAVSVFSDGLVSFAADSKNTEHILYGWGYNFSNSGLANAYDPLTGGKTNDAFNYKWAQEFFYWTDSSGNYCYCVQLGTDHEDSAVMSSITFNDNAMVKLYSDRNQRERVRAATIYAYKGKSKYGYSGNVELVASQAMIWAVSGGYFDSSSESLSTNESSLLGHIIAPTNDEHKDLINCYKKMKGDILSHLKIPSGTSIQSRTAPTYELKYNTSTKKYECTIKADSSISQFDFSKVDGVTFKKGGSNIKVSANENIKAGTKTVTLTKTKAKNSGAIEDCVPLVFQTKDNSTKSQMKVGYISGKDPVQAYIKLKISTGSAHLDKSFVDYFGNAQSATTNMYQAVRFNLIYSDGSSRYYVNANGSNGTYAFSSTGSQAQATAFGLDSSNGNLTVSGLPEGTYEWHEISTYPSYGTGSAQTFTVSADTTASCRFVNRSIAPDKGKLVIIKHNGSGEFLSGAVFEITAAEDIVINGYTVRHAGDLVDTVTTDANGRAETDTNIFRGYSYTITEIKAPVGYSRSAQPQTVKLATTVPEFEVSVSNSTWSVPVEITKKDVSTGELIPDCTFEILDENGTQIVTGVTDENGIAHFNLGYGKYFYREIAAPEIYEIDDTPYPFEITEEGVTFKAEMTDKKKTGSIKVTKSTAENRNIEGIKFIATGISESNKGIKLEAETDENGVAHFDKLVVGKYIISEDGSTVPYGYLVADEKEVKVEYAQTIDETILNAEQTGTVQVHKKTDGMTNIEGIRFILSGVSDTGREIRIEAVTDKDGLAKFEGVPIGTYTITEDGSTVPYGYLVADSKQVTVTYAQTVDTDMVNEKAPDTPNTGVTDNDTDGRTALCSVAIILAGAAVLMFSRKKKER